MDEFLKVWMKPEYLPMIVVLVPALKFGAIPLIKSLLTNKLNPNGYTPLWIAYIVSLILGVLYKIQVMNTSGWGYQDVISLLLVALITAQATIGLNVSIAAVRGADINVRRDN